MSSGDSNAVTKATETIYASRHHSDTAMVRLRLPLGAEGVDRRAEGTMSKLEFRTVVDVTEWISTRSYDRRLKPNGITIW